MKAMTTILCLLVLGLAHPTPGFGQQGGVITIAPLPVATQRACPVEPRTSHAWSAVLAVGDGSDPDAIATLTSLEDSLRVELEQRPDDVPLRHLLAAVLGTRAELQGGRSQIRAAKEMHAHAARILELSPRHAGAIHMIGRLHFEVMSMNRVKRFLATRVLGGRELSGANWTDAQALLEAAAMLEPCIPEHQYQLARLYRHRGDLESARHRLAIVASLEAVARRDRVVLERAQTMLAEIAGGP